jgi:large subunit ribosomal protein L23
MTNLYEVLRRPIVTEKSNYQMTGLHQYVFEVSDSATRTMIKDAVESIFNVSVLKVNIVNLPAKQSRRARSRRLLIRRPGYKKAIITLAAEDRIPFFEGVE